MTETKPRIWVRPGDCRDFMSGMKDNSVSLILTDPPYFLDGMGDEWSNESLNKRKKKPGQIGGSLPPEMRFRREQGTRLQNFLSPIADDWIRIIRPGGFLLCFSQNRLMHRAAVSLENAGFEIRDILAWRYEGQAKAFTQDHFIQKRNLPQSEKNRLMDKIAGRRTPQLKPQCELIILSQAPKDGTFVDNWDKWETGLIDISTPLIEPDKFPGTVIPVPKTRERYGHITAKPVELMRHLIRIFSCEKAMVFDPFAGSGSVGVAARLEDRLFCGSEIDKSMAETANRRIDNCLSTTLFSHLPIS